MKIDAKAIVKLGKVAATSFVAYKIIDTAIDCCKDKKVAQENNDEQAVKSAQESIDGAKILGSVVLAALIVDNSAMKKDIKNLQRRDAMMTDAFNRNMDMVQDHINANMAVVYENLAHLNAKTFRINKED